MALVYVRIVFRSNNFEILSNTHQLRKQLNLRKDEMKKMMNETKYERYEEKFIWNQYIGIINGFYRISPITSRRVTFHRSNETRLAETDIFNEKKILLA